VFASGRQKSWAAFWRRISSSALRLSKAFFPLQSLTVSQLIRRFFLALEHQSFAQVPPIFDNRITRVVFLSCGMN
jgi:hypothetical protein